MVTQSEVGVIIADVINKPISHQICTTYNILNTILGPMVGWDVLGRHYEQITMR